MKKNITLKDIARETGVHASTVSRALDPKGDTPLTAEVVARIRATAQRLGYRPNRVALSLRTRRTHSVGVVIPDIANMIFPPIVRGIESVLEPLGYASIIVNTDNQPEREQRLLEILRERGVDGVLHAAVHLRSPAIVAAVASDDLPVVSLNRRMEDVDVPHVINDDEAGIGMVFSLLHDLGHRRIGHLAGPGGLSTGQVRRTTFQRLAENSDLGTDGVSIVEATRFDEAAGWEAAEKILQQVPTTTALLCANDRLALGAIDHCRSVGLECPTDISVTGYNDMPFLERIAPRLSTIRIEPFEAGVVAARHLAALMDGRRADVPFETMLPVTLVEGDSVAKPRD